MAILSGYHEVTLDEKGRISIPAKLREGIPENVLVLSKSMFEKCIWAYTPENHEIETSKLKNIITANNSIPMTPRQNDMFDHRANFFISVMEIDKSGRIMIPPKFRDYAGLVRDCVISSNGVRIEIWDSRRFEEYEQKVEEEHERKLNGDNGLG